MDNDVVIVTASDEAYFPFCVDLIESIRKACGAMPRMRVLDVGMRPDQAAEIARSVEAVIAPGWDLGDSAKLPRWFRAMTARPCLPNYAGGAAMIAWIDCDAWVQRFEPIAAMIAAACDGRIALNEETFGAGFIGDRPADPGKVNKYVVTADSIKANIRSCYRLCFGVEIATALGDLPTFNSGVFALRADSPSWSVWRETLEKALPNAFHKLIEQQALTVAIRQGRIPVAPQPRETNYVCGSGLPWYSADQRAFTMPADEARPIGVVHLTDCKDFPVLRIPHFPDGTMRPTPLIYRDVQKYFEGGVNALDLPNGWRQLVDQWAREPIEVVRQAGKPETWGKVGRNEPCPCGSEMRYKQCHGKLA
jgi:hypothetical protein